MSDQRLEVLLSSEASGQMWNMCVWDPATGSALKTFKGSATKSRTTAFLGNTFLVSGQPNKPLLNVWLLNKHEQKPLKYIAPGVLQSIAGSPCGHFLVGTLEERIYIWQTSSGKLLRIITTGHYQKISVTKFTSDGSHFVTAGEDGNVLVWPISTVVNVNSSSCKPRYIWSNHSLGITDMHIGNGGANARVFTASKDQTAKVYCLSSGHLLLDVEFAFPLLSITVDSAEENAFVGTSNAMIFAFGLKSPPRDLKMSIESTSSDNTFRGHSAGITCLSVSLDGLMLASGSEDFDVRIWHVKSRQCTRVIPHKGSVTGLLYMIPKRGMLRPDDFVPDVTLSLLEKTVADKNLAKSDVYSIDIITSLNDSADQYPENSARDLLLNTQTFEMSSASAANGNEESDCDEIKRLKVINQKLYEASVKAILKE